MGRPGKELDASDAEWKRVLQNPDNMIVSDSLRDHVAGILTNRSESDDFFAELTIGDQVLMLELQRIDRGRDKTVVSGVCDKLTVKTVFALSMGSWSLARVLCGEESLLEINLTDQQLEVSYDMSSSAGLCFVTLTCMSPSVVSKKRVL